MNFSEKEKNLLIDVLSIHRERLYEVKKTVSRQTATEIDKEIEDITSLYRKICSTL